MPHWIPATRLSLAQTGISADSPSGKVPTARVRLRISRFSRSCILRPRPPASPPQALIAHNQPHALQSTAFQPLEEALPAGFVLLHAFLCAQSASVMSSTRRTDTPAKYISRSASSMLLSLRLYRSMMAVSKLVHQCFFEIIVHLNRIKSHAKRYGQISSIDILTDERLSAANGNTRPCPSSLPDSNKDSIARHCRAPHPAHRDSGHFHRTMDPAWPSNLSLCSSSGTDHPAGRRRIQTEMGRTGLQAVCFMMQFPQESGRFPSQPVPCTFR